MNSENNESLESSEQNELVNEVDQQIDSTEGLEEASQSLNDETTTKAKSFGHLDKEEWVKQGKDPNKWKSPQEFVKYGNEYGEVKELIKSLRQQNQMQADQINMLVDYHKRNAESSVKQAKQILEQELLHARQTGDVNAVEALTAKRFELQQQETNEKLQQQALEARRVDAEFNARNAHWFNESRPDLMQKARDLAVQINTYKPTASYAERVHELEMRMRLEHPEINVITQVRPQIPASNSSVNKSVVNTSTNMSEDRAYKSLNAEQQAEFEATKTMLAKMNIKYTIKEYLNPRIKIKN